MTEGTESVLSTEIKVGDTIKMFGYVSSANLNPWVPMWRKVENVRRSKTGATCYFTGSDGEGRRTDRTCRATTVIERKLD